MKPILVCASLFLVQVSVVYAWRCSSDANCKNGRICVSGQCKKRLTLGAQCPNPEWKCAEGLVCDKGGPKPYCMRVLKEGEPRCGANRYTKCGPGLTCAGKFGQDKCVKVLAVVAGVASTRKKLPLTVKKGDGGPCAKDADCINGLHCLGKPRSRRCKMKKPLGGQCGDPTWVCQTGLDCETKKGQRYGNCIKTMATGSPCGGKWIRCPASDKCIAGKCKKPAKDGFPCAKDEECVDGLHCLGKPESRRCKMKKPLGGQCGDPTWVCQDGLDCETKKGQRYGNCVRTMSSGAPCTGEQWERCAAGNKCITGKCSPPAKDGFPCTKDGDCVTGLHCLGKPESLRCKMKKPLGGQCRDPTWVCQDGLDCETRKGQRYGNCVQTLSSGDLCAGKWARCGNGLACVKGKCGVPLPTPSPSSSTPASSSPIPSKSSSPAPSKTSLPVPSKSTSPGPSEPSSPVPSKSSSPVPSKSSSPIPSKSSSPVPSKSSSPVPSKSSSPEPSPSSSYSPEPKKKKDGFPCKKDDDCETGLHCLGKPGSRRCKMKKPLGGQCGDPTWVCQDGLDCETKKGQIYGNCVRTMSSGSPCGDKWIRCATGINCIIGKCSPPAEVGFPCGKDDDCVTGLHCLGKPESRRCKMKKPLGGQCGDPTWVCQEGLDCETKNGQRYGNCVRTMSAGSPCSSKWDRCTNGYKCINAKCRKPVPTPSPSSSAAPSQSSSPAPSKSSSPVPSKSSSPVPSKSTSPEPSPSSSASQKPKKQKDGFPCKKDDDCVSGLHCLGKAESRRCKMKKPLGGQCGDPTWVCQDGLDCETKKGERYGNCVRTMSSGSPCGDKWIRCASGTKCIIWKCSPPVKDGFPCGKDDDCVTGLCCLGKPETRRCKMKKPLGGQCGDPTWVCQDGLDCERKKGQRYGNCVRTMSAGAPCSSKWDRCTNGYKCIDAKCRKPVPTLSPSSSAAPSESSSPAPSKSSSPVPSKSSSPAPSKSSSPKLSESSSPSPKPKKQKDGFPCKKDDDCVTGLHCLGKPESRRCKMKKPLGEQCGDPTWVCQDGLDCETKKGQRYGNCVRTSPEKGPCTNKWERCAKGTKCISGTCKKPVKDGFPCAKDEECVDGLHCLGKPESRRCKMKKPLGGQCGDPTWVCQDGLDCETKKGQRYGNCVRTMPVGSPCSSKWDRCSNGYKCIIAKCRKPVPSPSSSSSPVPSKSSSPVPSKSSSPVPSKSSSPIPSKSSSPVPSKSSSPIPSKSSSPAPSKSASPVPSKFSSPKPSKSSSPKPSRSSSPSPKPKKRKDGFPCKKHSDCVKGLHCLGKPSSRRCKMKKPLGGKCGDPTRVCRDGLKCVTKKGQRYGNCVHEMPEGGKCKGWHKCKAGLHCIKGKCSKQQDCRRNPRLCNRRTHYCLVKKGKAMCKKLMKRGESCRDPTWRCGPGLICVGKGKKAFCWRRWEARRKCRCSRNEACLSGGRKWICVPAVGIGKPCGRRARALCRRGKRLSCRRGRCVRVVRPYQKCGARFVQCTGRFRCLGKKGDEKCRRGY